MSFLPEVKCTGSLRAGSFRGFDVEISLSEYGKRTLALKGQLRHIIELGTDARGNIQRIENALTGLDRQLENARGRLADLERQVENAREELKKPFPQEAELAEKSVRLIELNAELDMENSAPVQEDAETERPSVLAKLREPIPLYEPRTQQQKEACL